MKGDSLAAGLSARRGRGLNYWFDIVAGRLIPALVFSVFVADKVLVVGDSLRHGLTGTELFYALTQVLGLLYFTMIVVLYVVRLPKRAGDSRPAMIVTSFFGSFSVLLVGFLPGVPRRDSLVVLSDLMLATGLIYTVWSLGYLRRSFSILPQARRLVTGGPYALSRHPLYLGEAVAGIGLTLPTVGWAGAVLLALFLLAQVVRIRAEEAVLSRQFPEEYAAYSARVPRYLPRPWKLGR